MLYKRYQNTSTTVLSINLQIATILKILTDKINESNELFKSFKAKQAIELGENASKIATSFATIISDAVYELTNDSSVDSQTKKDLKELNDYFISIAVLITQFNYSRDENLFERLVNSIKAMEKAWRDKN